MSQQKGADLALLKRLLTEARPYWPHLGAIFALDLLAAPLALLTPVPLMLAVDSIIGSEPLPPFLDALVPDWIAGSTFALLIAVAVFVVMIAVLNNLQHLGTWLLQTYTGEKLALEFRGRVLRHAQRLSLVYHDTQGTADSIYRVQYDAPAIQWVVIYGLTPFLTASFTLLGMIYVTAMIDWELAVVALTVSPILYVLTQVFRKRLRRQWRNVKNLEMSALSIVQEVLGSLRTVKAFGQEEREYGRFLGRSSEGVTARIAVVVRESLFHLLVAVTVAGGTAVVLYLGVTHVQSGVITLGQLLLVMSYLAQLYQPLKSLGQQVTKLQGGLTSAERAFELLDKDRDVPEKPDALPLAHAEGGFAFRNVSFSYDGVTPVLQNISFSVRAGSRVGIMGKTGAGKSTLVNLLMRFYDATEGRILLDGVDIRDYKLADLRDQYGIVLQEPVLLHASIAQNIAYGRPLASEQLIENAAKAANADEFIRKLPQGYDTMVGERGLRLSGGQRQRIALARAFLKDAPILILDEPTSSVDVKTEALIMEAMKRLMEGRTTFMIAHRLTTLDSCDVVLVLDDGKLAGLNHGEMEQAPLTAIG